MTTTNSRDELCWLSIAEAAPLIESGALSPVELTRAHLERIERVDPSLNSFITVLGDEASGAGRRRRSVRLRPATTGGRCTGFPLG